MKRAGLVCLFAAAAAMVAGSSNAMAWAPERTMVKIPFAFDVSGVTLPAGEYSIEKLSTQVVQVRGMQGAALAGIKRHVGATTSNSKPQLVFQRRDGKNTLQEVWLQSAAGGLQLFTK